MIHVKIGAAEVTFYLRVTVNVCLSVCLSVLFSSLSRLWRHSVPQIRTQCRSLLARIMGALW